MFSRLCDASPPLPHLIWSAAVALVHAFDKPPVICAVLIARYRPATFITAELIARVGVNFPSDVGFKSNELKVVGMQYNHYFIGILIFTRQWNYMSNTLITCICDTSFTCDDVQRHRGK